MHDSFDYREFLSKNKLGPYAKTKALNENYIDLRPINEFVEENQQEDEDGDEVTHRFTEPRPIEVVSMGSNGAVIKVEKPNGDIEDVDFELGPEIEEVDPPYGYEGTIYGEIDGVEYGIAVSLVDMGGAGYDMDLSYDGLTFLEGKDPNQQEDEDGEQVTLSEDDMEDLSSDIDAEEAGIENTEDMEGITEGSDNGYQEFMNVLTPIIDLAKKGVITEKEKSDILAAAHPAFKRLQAEKED